MDMLHRGAYSFLAASLWLSLSLVQGDRTSVPREYDSRSLCVCAGEVCVGTLSGQHDVAGRLCFIDQTTLVIRDFEYDGGGPGQ